MPPALTPSTTRPAVATASGHLTTGWEPDVAVDDSLLRTFLFHQADLCHSIADAAGGTTDWTGDVVVADTRRPSGYWSSAYLLAPPVSWDDTLDRVESALAGGVGEAMLWSAWPTPDLTARGWRLSGHPPLLLRPPASDVPVAEPADEPADDWPGCERVRDADGLREWEQVVIDGYPLPEVAGLPPGAVVPTSLLGDPRFTWWIARDRSGRPVSAGMSFESRGIASLALGATLRSARHHGHWRAHAAARLAAHPDRWFAGVFSDFSRAGAQRLGFVPLTRLTLWILDRPERSTT